MLATLLRRRDVAVPIVAERGRQVVPLLHGVLLSRNDMILLEIGYRFTKAT